MSEGPDEAVNNNTNALNDYMYSTPIDISSMYGPTPLLDFNSLSTESTTSATMAPGYFPTPDATPFLDSLFSANLDSDCMDMGPHQAMNGESECNCHEGVTELLVCMRGAGKDQRLSLDAQLARLKQCTVSSEVSMGCTHPRDDSEPIHIMAVAMLIGYAIDDFKTLASESSLRRSTSSQSTADMVTLGNTEKDTKPRVPTPNSSNMSLRDLMEPRLSLGVLELEEDDEMDLRQRLYQLSFRKLERLLSQLTVYLRDLHSDLSNLPDPSRHMAFVIACDYTRLWLERKASDVKRLFSVPSKDETMDSAIV
jgi:hypothetical protein